MIPQSDDGSIEIAQAPVDTVSAAGTISLQLQERIAIKKYVRSAN
jgi:hypothetical protein